MAKSKSSDDSDLPPPIPPDGDTCPPPPIPPDGGWGWVIMFASFICNVIVDGVCFSFGIFYLEFLSYYGESKAKTSWVGSVLNGMYLSMGPIVSALANKFGCRAVTIAGSILACVSYILAIYSPNVDILILTYGAMGGMGFGLMYLPAIVMVGFYFEKRRAFATGVAVCGSGIGAFVFAPMCEKLLTVYGWKGATLIVAGIVLNGVVMGALFRPLESPTPRRRVPTITLATEEETMGGSEINIHKAANGGVLQPKDLLKQKLKKMSIENGGPESGATNITLQSMHNLNQGNMYSDTEDSSSKLVKSMNDIYLQCDNGEGEERHKAKLAVERPMYRKDIFYSGSIMNLPEFKSAENMVSYVKSVTSIPREAEAEKRGFCHACKSLTDTLGEMMDFSLLKNPVFTVYGMSCFLCMTGFFVPFIYLPDCAIQKGVTRDQAAFLLSIIGIANTIGRVLCGWVSDQSWSDCLLINNCALIIGGGATMLLPFCNSYGLMAAYASVFGMGIAAFVSLRSILMVELIGLDKLTNAFGLVTMCQGFSAFIGAPIAGGLYDATGNYDISFYVAGATLALAGIICLPLRRIAAWKKSRDLARDQSHGITPDSSSHKLVPKENGVHA